MPRGFPRGPTSSDGGRRARPQMHRRAVAQGVTAADWRTLVRQRDALTKPQPQEHWNLYLLQSARGHFYVGVTPDVRARLRKHNGYNNGGAQRTKRHRPWRLLLFVHGFHGKRDALRAELAVHRPTVCTALRPASIACADDQRALSTRLRRSPPSSRRQRPRSFGPASPPSHGKFAGLPRC